MSARRGVYESRFGTAVMLAVATMFGGSALVAGARPLPIQGAKPVSLDLAEKRIAFEVVSIRVRPPHPAGGFAGDAGKRGASPSGGSHPCGSSIVQITPGRFVATNITLYRLIALAFGRNCRASAEIGLISGGPAWLHSDQFDIQAVIPEGSPAHTVQQLSDGQAPELQMMIQAMLRDRFKLSVHNGMREGPAYNLVLVRLGKVKLSEDQVPPAPVTLSPSGQPLGLDSSKVPTRGFSFRIDPSTDKATISATAVPLSTMIDLFQGLDGRFVVDKTGLKGLIDIPAQILDVGHFAIGGLASVWPEVLRQLGMNLEPTRTPLEILAIDSVEKPSGN